MKCPHCEKEIPRFWGFSGHELSIFFELLKEPNDTFLFLDAQPCMKDQGNPHETTREALLLELNNTPCHCCHTKEDF